VKKQKETNLFSEFEPVSREEWEEQIKKDLKGADYKEKLKWDTLEGFSAYPFYRTDNLKELEFYSPDTIRTNIKSTWKRCELISESDPIQANTQLKQSVKGGANAFQIKSDIAYSDGAIGGNMIGTQLQSQKDFNELVADIDLSEFNLFVNSGMNTPALLAMIQNSDADIRDAFFFFDPFTYTAEHGREPLPPGKLNSTIRQIANKTDFKTLCSDGLFYHTSGATIIQELGISLAIASEYLARSSDEDLNDTANTLFFRLSAGPLYFPEIAKFRAARILWTNLLNAYGIDNSLPLHIHAETTPQNQTFADPHNNILRATTEAMSAVIGGVDSLTIQPHDSQFNSTNSFSSRIARNIHHIIAEEAHFGKVDDPAAGSYYVEQLTEEIAQKSWEFFQLIEKQGGFLDALKNRIIQSEIETAKNRKLQAYANGKRTLVGTNNYPNSDQKIADTIIETDFTNVLKTTDHSPSIDSSNLIDSLSENLDKSQLVGDLFKSYSEPQKVLHTSLEPFRAAEIFESIRHRTQKHTQSTNKNITVQLVPVGNHKWRKLRSTFASNMLGCAGFSIDSPIGFESVESAFKKLKSESSEIYVLCGADDEYPELIKPFCELFVEKGALLLAGNPQDKEDDFRKFGIDHFIYSGMNIPETLSEIQDQIFNSEKASS
jgi:methylmalonyl-CoA mutase